MDTRKQSFLEAMRKAAKSTPDPEAAKYLEMHVRNVLPMSERQFGFYEKKLVEIIKKHGNNSIAVNMIRNLARRGS